MRKILISLVLSFLGLVGFVFSSESNHLMLSEVCIGPDVAEMIKIHNPTEHSINLNEEDIGSYYLTDDVDSYIDCNGLDCDDDWSGQASDFFMQFPEDLIINSGETLTIGMHDESFYSGYYSLSNDPYFNSNIDLNLHSLYPDNFFNIEFSVLGPKESLVLFFWDNVSNTVKEVDYLLWGDDTYTIDGISTDNFLDESDDHYIYSRKSYNENESDGNGITGHDETSEDFSKTWETIKIPGIYPGCTDSEAVNYDVEANYDEDCYVLQPGYPVYTITDIVQSNYIEELGENLPSLYDMDCDYNPPDGGYNVTVVARVKGYTDIRPWGGPEIIILEDRNGYQIEATAGAYPDLWSSVENSSIGYMIDVTNPNEYLVAVYGRVCSYVDDGEYSLQFQIVEDIHVTELKEYKTRGNFVPEDEDDPVIKAEIIVKPYVIIPSLGERLDFEYSFPSNSRVIIRIFNLNGNFVTSIVDKFYQGGGTVERYDDESDWNGRDHLGQIVPPGTYLIHIEASDFDTGKTTIDVAPIVVGAHH